MNDLFEQIAQEYMLLLLNWAYKKTGCRDKAEDLTQEVLLQIFTAIRKSDSPIEDTEHFVWKVAHYTWCNYLRRNARQKMLVPMEDLQLEDDSNFAADYAEQEYQREMTLRMRRQISLLSFQQRDIMISFYLDGLSVQQIAEKNGMTQSAVKWHLFQTRKKLKKEMDTMENNEYVYRPRTLHMGLSGQIPYMANSDIKMIENSATKQNICLACYRQPLTTEELAARLGIHAAYIEHDLKWLTRQEFVEKNGSRYSTSFLITTAEEEQNIYGVYVKHREALSDFIIKELTAGEDKIRAIGFHGCDAPFDRLLWMLIYQFCLYMHIPYPDVERPIRMDGGKYLPLGFDRSDFDTVAKNVNTAGWGFNGSMQNDNFYWIGLYNFSRSEIETMLDAYTPEGAKLHELLCRLIHSDFSMANLEEAQQFTLAQLVQKGFVSIKGELAVPNFCVFTLPQYKQLKETVFGPLAEKLKEETRLLTADLEECCKNMLPPQLQKYSNFLINLHLGDLAYLTTIFAFEDGRLYCPKDSHDGEFLTLVYVKQTAWELKEEQIMPYIYPGL